MKRFKKTIVFLLMLCLLGSLAGCGLTGGSQTAEPPAGQGEEAGSNITPMTPGDYTVEVTGMKPMTVKVTLGETEITSVEVLAHEETPGVSDAALEEIPAAIVTQQSIEVDTISGATITSQAIIDAVKQAIEEAGGVADEFMVAAAGKEVAAGGRQGQGSAQLPDAWDMTYDVVVVGGGFAGLAAAYSAVEHGAETLLIDKMPVLVGNSQINGGVYAS